MVNVPTRSFGPLQVHENSDGPTHVLLNRTDNVVALFMILLGAVAGGIRIGGASCLIVVAGIVHPSAGRASFAKAAMTTMAAMVQAVRYLPGRVAVRSFPSEVSIP